MNSQVYSIIIPTLNEASNIVPCIKSIQKHIPDAQIIVVDGGSRDQTLKNARQQGAEVFLTSPGRGHQCRLGGEMAHGKVLIFIHADSTMCAGVLEDLNKNFLKGNQKIGQFKPYTNSDSFSYKILDWFGQFDSIITSFGDQGIIVQRSFYHEIGGFPKIKLFEDIEFLRIARRKNGPIKKYSRLIISPRRFVIRGFIIQLLEDALLLTLYCLGVNPDKLYSIYYRKISSSDHYDNILPEQIQLEK